MPYVFANLTSAIRDKGSPLRIYLDERFPHVRPIQSGYREHAGALLVDGSDANPGILGAAFDFQVRFTLDPSATPTLPTLAFAGRDGYLAAIGRVIEHAKEAVVRADVETLGRACWALALCTEVYRVGLVPRSPLERLIVTGRFTISALLALAPAGGIRQLGELHTVAQTNLLPYLSTPLHLGPTFDGSRLCPADADLIAAGLLLDIKTHLGPKSSRTGIRRDSLPLVDLYQILAYALLDYSDTYKITGLGIYSARYGRLARWPIIELMTTLAGEPVDLAQERTGCGNCWAADEVFLSA